MPRMVSNIHRSRHSNDLNPGVWISSCLFPSKFARRASVRKRSTCHIRACDLLMMTSFIHSWSPYQNLALHNWANRAKSKIFPLFPRWRSHMRHDIEDKHISSFLYARPLISVSGWASRRFLSAPSSSLTDEKQCALFHYTVNPISCFTLCRGAAERGNGWDGAGQCWHKSHNPWGNASCWGSPE